MNEILVVRNLKKYFNTPSGPLHAVDDVTFSIEKGKTMGIVGESGCGKSTLGRTIIRLLDITEGQVIFDGVDITKLNRREEKKLHEEMQMIFQDPYSSLNPRMTVSEIIREPLIISRKYTKGEIEAEAEKIMDLVGIDRRLKMAYPHELDGGRRQRVGIGRALALSPKLVICDEPVSALDVSIQAQILNLMQDLQEKLGITYIFITHDLSVVRHISHTIGVMYLGQLVETAETKKLFANPMHPYTKALLSAIPSTNIHRKNDRILLSGEVVSPINPKPGCRFAARCRFACEKCMQVQKLAEYEDNHFVACFRAGELTGEK